ncbi:MAG: hypothetical protein LBR24_03985 [Methanobrevibacter sp.]|nr:hypothetical protein [Methanobrevibacter sp.]
MLCIEEYLNGKLVINPKIDENIVFNKSEYFDIISLSPQLLTVPHPRLNSKKSFYINLYLILKDKIVK